MTTTLNPLIVGLPLGRETEDVLLASKELGQRIECPIVVVHALAERRLENERGLSQRIQGAKQALAPHLARLRDAGLDAHEEVAVGAPADLVVGTAQRLGAELIVTGGGRRSAFRRWMAGSVAEAIVRRAFVPVWVARGRPPVRQPVLCPVDLSAQSKLGFASAVRMALLLDAPLRVITVLSKPLSAEGREAEDARRGIDELLEDHAIEGLEVEVVMVRGVPAERIVEASNQAGLLVVGSRGYDPLVPAWLGPVTTRALRSSRCSVLAIREVDVDLEQRERAIGDVADAYRAARELIEDDRAAEALPLIEMAAERAPVNATIQETYAIALKKVGREVEARGRHEIAEMIRSRIGPR